MEILPGSPPPIPSFDEQIVRIAPEPGLAGLGRPAGSEGDMRCRSEAPSHPLRMGEAPGYPRIAMRAARRIPRSGYFVLARHLQPRIRVQPCSRCGRRDRHRPRHALDAVDSAFLGMPGEDSFELGHAVRV